MVRFLILATMLAAAALAVGLWWRGTTAADPFMGIDNADLRAQARQAAEQAMPNRAPENKDAMPSPTQPSPADPVPAMPVTTEAQIDEARLRDQTRERALTEAQRRTTVIVPTGSAKRPWFVPVARPEDPLEAAASSPSEPPGMPPPEASAPRQSRAMPAWQRR